MKLSFRFLFILIFFILRSVYGQNYPLLLSQHDNFYMYNERSKDADLIDNNTYLDKELLNSITSYIPKIFYEALQAYKVLFVFDDSLDYSAFFFPKDQLQKKYHKFKKMNFSLYIFLDPKILRTNRKKSVLSHEIFHALHYVLSPSEETWMREGLAQLFEFIVTSRLNNDNFYQALINPLTPLMGTYKLHKNDRAQYGHNLMYFYYLYEHCGGVNLFWNIVKGQKNLNGRKLLDYILKNNISNLSKKNECSDFTKSAIFFEIAKIHNKNVYTQNDISTEYFVYPWIREVTLPLFKMSKLNEIMPYLPLFTPLGLECDNVDDVKKLKNFLASKMKIFGLNSHFPYNISESNIKSDYRCLLLRVK